MPADIRLTKIFSTTLRVDQSILTGMCFMILNFGLLQILYSHFQCFNLLMLRLLIFTFFCIHEKEVMDLQKFLTSNFWSIYMFWDVLNMIWPFLKNVCVCMPPKFCGHCIKVSRTNGRNLMKLYIQLHHYVI